MRFEGPGDAARSRIERVDDAVLAADEQPSTDDRRLRPRRCRVGKAERPLQAKPRHLLGGEAGLIARLEMRVVHAGAHPFQRAPLVGSVSGGTRAQRPAVAPTTVPRRLRPVRNPGDRSAFGAAQRQALVAHRSGRERRRRSPVANVLAIASAAGARGSSPLWHEQASTEQCRAVRRRRRGALRGQRRRRTRGAARKGKRRDDSRTRIDWDHNLGAAVEISADGSPQLPEERRKTFRC